MHLLRIAPLIAFAVLAVCQPWEQAPATSPETTGQVVDCDTQHPIEGAWVTVGKRAERSDKNGRFTIAQGTQFLDVRAIGYKRAHVETPRGGQIPLTPLRVHGLYLSFWGVGSQILRSGALETIRTARLNAIVIDVKGDRGLVSFKTNSAMAHDAGANSVITIPDAQALIKDLHQLGLYCIARIVVFKDNPVARAWPQLAVKTVQGLVYVDREGLSWTDPFNQTVWEYNGNIAVEAARAGFDEIQFDYVRFPDQKGLRFSKANTEFNRREAITNFLATVRVRLTEYNVFLSADSFGYVCWNKDDTGIGQCFSDIGTVADYICPMLYPSSFQYGVPGLKNPLSDPFRIVYASLKHAEERTGFSALTFRPWLQAFSDYAFDHRKFGKSELRQQILAAQDAGSDGWLLWDPRNRYDTSTLAELSSELKWANR